MRLVAIGLVSGFCSALLGVGGGIIVVPLLLLVCKFDARSATATSLAAIGITAVSGTITYAAQGDIAPAHAGLIGLPAALAVIAATALQQRIRLRTLELLFSAFLVVVAVWLLVK